MNPPPEAGAHAHQEAGTVVSATRYVPAVLALLAAPFLMLGTVLATPEFSCQTELSCTQCHVDPEGGDPLTQLGERFRAADYVLDADAAPPKWRRNVRLAVGFLHILAAVIWFGTIFYVHLFIRARSYTGGLPRNERILGVTCIVLVGLTGIVLTLFRIHTLDQLWTTTFGIVWMIKVGLFLMMVFIAASATTFLHRHMRKAGARSAEAPEAAADGREGRPAHIIYQGILYDVSESRLWAEGRHMGKHLAGGDLTPSMADAPHGAEVLERMKNLGPAPEAGKPALPASARVFLFLAYAVLGIMLGVLFCVAYWNWGPPLVTPPV